MIDGVLTLVLFNFWDKGVQIAIVMALAFDTALCQHHGFFVSGSWDWCPKLSRGRQRCFRHYLIAYLWADSQLTMILLVGMAKTTHFFNSFRIHMHSNSLSSTVPATVDRTWLAFGRGSNWGWVRTVIEVEAETIIDESLEGAFEGGLDDGHNVFLAYPSASTHCVAFQQAHFKLVSELMVCCHKYFQTLTFRPFFLFQLFISLSVAHCFFLSLSLQSLKVSLLPQIFIWWL